MRRWTRFLRYHCSWLSLATGLAIAYLAVINPLACLIHCARHESAAHVGSTDQLAHYVCLLENAPADPPAATADYPIPLRTNSLDAASMVPEAVYPAILSRAGQAIVHPARPRIARPAIQSVLQRRESPPSPPPEHTES